MMNSKNNHFFSKVKVKEIKKFEVVGKRCYAEILFEDGYHTSVNVFETNSVGTVKDSHLDMLIPEGSYHITFKVSKPGFGVYYLSRLSLTLLGA